MSRIMSESLILSLEVSSRRVRSELGVLPNCVFANEVAEHLVCFST